MGGEASRVPRLASPVGRGVLASSGVLASRGVLASTGTLASVPLSTPPSAAVPHFEALHTPDRQSPTAPQPSPSSFPQTPSVPQLFERQTVDAFAGVHVPLPFWKPHRLSPGSQTPPVHTEVPTATEHVPVSGGA